MCSESQSDLRDFQWLNVFSAFLGNAQAVQKAVSRSIDAPRCDTQAGDER